MVLEEELWFLSEEPAQECAKLLKSLGVSAHIRTKYDLDISVMYKAPYISIKGMLEEEKAKIDQSDDDKTSFFTTILTDAIGLLDERRALLEKTFSEKTPGEKIGLSFDTLLTIDNTDTDDEERMKTIASEMQVTQLLEMNDLLDTVEDSFVLNGTISPDDAKMAVFSDDIPPLDEETLARWNVQSTLEAADMCSYIVTASPDIIFLEDTTPLEKFFEETECDNSEEFLANLQIKQVVTAELLSIIQKDGKAMKEDLVTEFIHRNIPLNDEKSGIGLHISPGYIEAVVSDLKKIGMLKGKDNKLKIAL